MDRVCIFIDGSNFYHALVENGKSPRVDFGKLAAALVGDQRQLVQIYYYNTPLLSPKASDINATTKEKARRDQQRFFNALRYVPHLTFKQGRFQRLPNGGQVEKGVDVMIAVDMVNLAYKNIYDVAILITSDADLKSAVEVIKSETGKSVELSQVQGAKSYDLITACDVYRPIDDAILAQCTRL
jgi:uncharacterized LabA/DUF88 family protein